jgi:hypothetical protein
MFLEALLSFNLYIQDMRDRLEHPKALTFETRQAWIIPTVKVTRERASIVWTIRFK